MSDLVRVLLPSLSVGLAEEFNIFRVMHHGTHEKQLSNVFAWLLDSSGSHGLGEIFQRVFVSRMNEFGAGGGFPLSGYTVSQEVDTVAPSENMKAYEKDVADIVLTAPGARIVVENYHTSDGHGHDYHRYLRHATRGGSLGAVVLLCHREEAHRLRDGWELGAVVTYRDLLADLQMVLRSRPRWVENHPEQMVFVQHMFNNFLEGPALVNVNDQIEFMNAMCETGESVRYGHRPIERASQEFADVVAEYARRQFDEGRDMLRRVKTALRSYGQSTLLDQVNASFGEVVIQSVAARFVGKWEWCVNLYAVDGWPDVELLFGPSAAAEFDRPGHERVPRSFAHLFVNLHREDLAQPPLAVQSSVTLIEVLEGLPAGDARLCGEIVALLERTPCAR